MPTKSSRAFRTISEASEELGLKPHVLRFWEAKFPDLSPVTRGGGRRFYRPEDVDFLRGLRILLHDEKLKIKDVQKLIKVKGAQSIVELGHSSVDQKPSRPIPQRDLVPERIKQKASKPQIAQPQIAQPQIAQAEVSRAVIPDVLTAEPRPAVEPRVVPFKATEKTGPVLSEDSRIKMDAALLRLKELRGRWDQFKAQSPNEKSA